MTEKSPTLTDQVMNELEKKRGKTEKEKVQAEAYNNESYALDCFAALEKVSKRILSKSHPSKEVADVINALEELLPVRVRGKWRALQEKLIWWVARYPQLRESKDGKRLSLMCDEDTVSIRHIAPQDVATHFSRSNKPVAVSQLFEDPRNG